MIRRSLSVCSITRTRLEVVSGTYLTRYSARKSLAVAEIAQLKIGTRKSKIKNRNLNTPALHKATTVGYMNFKQKNITLS